MSAASRPRGLVIAIDGPAGAGKSTVLRTLEDLGWETVDNLPLSLLDRLLSNPVPQGSQDEERPLAHCNAHPRRKFRDAERAVSLLGTNDLAVVLVDDVRGVLEYVRGLGGSKAS